MSFVQGRWVLGALAIAESAWLFAVFGIVGVIFRGDASPLGWIAVLAILGTGLVFGRVLQMIVMSPFLSSAIILIAGVLTIYLTVGTQVLPEQGGMQAGWLATLVRGADVDGFMFRAAGGSLLGLLLWWRGARLGSSEYPPEALEASFKLGVFALGVAIIVDIASPADLNTFPMMFIFIAAGLGGLSVSHLLPGPGRSIAASIWARVIGGVVGVILLAGLLFSLLQRDSLAVVAEPFLLLLRAAAIAFFYVFIIPAAFIIDRVAALLRPLLRGEAVDLQSEPGFGEQFLEAARPGSESASNALEWIVLGVVILVAVVILARAFRRRSRRRFVWVEGIRESVREDADAGHDLMELAWGLIPQRFRRRKRRRRAPVPDGEPGVVEALKLYYRMLSVAGSRGSARASSETPLEFQGTLGRIFPVGLARLATEAFNRARYGRHAATSGQLDAIRGQLEDLGHVRREPDASTES